MKESMAKQKYKITRKQKARRSKRKNEPRAERGAVRSCTHPQRTRRQEQGEKLRKARAKRTDQQQLAELDKVFGKGKGAKKERARLKERIKDAKSK